MDDNLLSKKCMRIIIYILIPGYVLRVDKSNKHIIENIVNIHIILCTYVLRYSFR